MVILCFVLIGIVSSVIGQLTSSLRGCTTSDIVSVYTRCLDNERSAFFYFNYKSCNGSHPSNPPLPAPRFGLRCDIDCEEGEYLPVGESKCQQCDPGYSSLGGGHVYSQWTEWPAATQEVQFESWCETNNGFSPEAVGQRMAPSSSGSSAGQCGWQLASSRLVSANTSDYQTAVLEARVRLVEPGWVRFSFEVSAEPRFDGILFFVDGTVAMKLVSATQALKEFQANLTTAGEHTLRWAYFKDIADSEGDDSAALRSIEIYGTQYSDERCSPCPAGHRALASGASRCTPCPANTATAATGSPDCSPCPPDKFAYPGATDCQERPACQGDEFEELEGPCTLEADGTRSRSHFHVWLEPVTCDRTSYEMDNPPHDSRTPCGPCNAGHYLPDGQALCAVCPPGQYLPRADGAGEMDGGAQDSSTTPSKCMTCPAGSEAVRELDLDRWDEWPAALGTRSRCVGDNCATQQGWRLRGSHADSGTGHGPDIESVLELPTVRLDRPGRISYEYRLVCPAQTSSSSSSLFSTSADCELRFEFECVAGECLNGVPDGVAGAAAGSATHHGYSWGSLEPGQYKSDVFELGAAGTYSLSFTFANGLGDTVDRRAHAELHWLHVYAATDGGALSCEPCPAGHYSSESTAECLPCKAGEGASSDRQRCLACPPDQFAPFAGAGCRPCPPGTSAPAGGAKECVHKCGEFDGLVTGRRYDLRPLESTQFPAPVEVNDHTYEVGVCSKERGSSVRCRRESGDPVDAFACQVLENGIGISLGNRIGLSELDAAAAAAVGGDVRSDDGGVVVQYSNGDANLCWLHPWAPTREPNGELLRRSANVTVVCDPGAGLGVPQPCESGVEPGPCHYCFVWRSLYGCPVCSEKDWGRYFGDCDPATQTRPVLYLWKESPPRCHGGSPLPRNGEETVPCGAGDDSGCEPGAFKPVDASSDQCVACTEPGSYSTGDGVQYLQASQTVTTFAGIAFPFGVGAVARADSRHPVAPARGGWHVLNATYQLVAPAAGSVAFRWSVREAAAADAGQSGGSSDDGSSQLVFVVRRSDDGVTRSFQLWPRSSLFRHSSSLGVIQETPLVAVGQDSSSEGPAVPSYLFKIGGLRAGVYEVEWRFRPAPGGNGQTSGSPSTSGTMATSVSIFDIMVRGTGAAPQCLQCPPGLVRTQDRSSCVVCPAGQVPTGDQEKCQDCPNGQWSLPGDIDCMPQDDFCSEDGVDIVFVLGECSPTTDQQTRSALMLPPQRCRQLAPSVDANVDQPCGSCPLGHRYVDGACEPCPDGQFLSAATSKCTDIEPSLVAVRKAQFFHAGSRPGQAAASDGKAQSQAAVVSLPVQASKSRGPLYSEGVQLGLGLPARGGWRDLGRFADSGVPSTGVFESVLVMELVAARDLDFSVAFTLFLYGPHASVEFYVAGKRVWSLASDSAEAQHDAPEFTVAWADVLADARARSDSCAQENAVGDCQVSMVWRFQQDADPSTSRRAELSDVTVGGPGFPGGALLNAAMANVDQATCPEGSVPVAGQQQCRACAAGSSAGDAGTRCDPCVAGTYSPSDGGACLPCPVGTTSEAGMRRCYPSPGQGCRFAVPAGGAGTNASVFEVGAQLASQIWQTEAVRDGLYYISPCHPVQQGDLAGQLTLMDGVSSELTQPLANFDSSDPGVCGPLWHVARRRFGESTSTGQTWERCTRFGTQVRAEFPNRVRNMDVSEGDPGLVLHFELGDADSTCPSGRSATVQFNCDPSSSGIAGPVHVAAHNDCQQTFVWVSRAGCPVCRQDQDYTIAVGDQEASACFDGSRKGPLVRKSGAVCNAVLEGQLGSLPCTGLSTPYWAVGVFGSIVVLLVLCTGCMFIKNRRLSHKYSNLTRGGGPTSPTRMVSLVTDSDEDVLEEDIEEK